MVLTHTSLLRLLMAALLFLPAALFAQQRAPIHAPAAQGRCPADSIAAQALTCFKKGNYAEADSLYIQALALKEAAEGENSPGYISVLCDYIDLCIESDKLKDLQSKIDRVMAARAVDPGKNSVGYAEILCHLGRYLIYTSQFSRAEEALGESLRIRREQLGEDSSPYIYAMIEMGTVQLYKQALAQAEECYTKAARFAEQIGDKRNQSYANISLAILYTFTGRTQQARTIFPDAIKMYQEQVGERHPTCIGALSGYALFFVITSNHREAELLYTQILALANDVLNEEHRLYLTALKALAGVYLSQGKYRQAEELTSQSARISKRLYGESSVEYASNLNQLGPIYMNLGDYARAEQIMVQSIEIQSKHPEAFRRTKASVYNSLGVIYLRQRRYGKALELFRESLALQKADKLLDNFLSQAIINNICSALLGGESQDFSAIEQDLLDALEIQKTKGSLTTAYLGQLTNLSALYRKTKQYDKSIARAEEAIAGYEAGPGTTSWQFINLLQHYSQALHLAGYPDKALATYSRCLGLMKVLAARDFLFLTEQERMQYWNAYNINIKEYLHFVISSDGIGAGFGYDCELFAKNLLLGSELALQKAIRESNDAELIASWKAIKEQPEARSQEQERSLLAALTKSGVIDQFSVGRQQVQQALGSGEAAIEVINAPTRMDGTGQIGYYALILTASSETPALVPLCTHEELEQALGEGNVPHTFYRQLWTTLEPYLRQTPKIYIALSGLFNRISFDALQDEKGYLTNRYEFHRLLSTRDIQTLKGGAPWQTDTPSLVLFGGIDYGVSPEPLPGTNTSAGVRGQGFDYLPGSLQEVKAIEKITRTAHWEVTLFTDRTASEAQLRDYSGRSPAWLHLSTHGFYLTQGEGNRFKQDEDPMKRSGLLLSGANRSWTGADTLDTSNDGVLTAHEIAGLDLSNTELVILSACNTALGDIDYSEGVYGLQRAFRMAGVQKTIVTLWEIPDKESAEFMKEFYTALRVDRDVATSFRRARQYMQRKYSAHPEKWAGFVLIE